MHTTTGASARRLIVATLAAATLRPHRASRPDNSVLDFDHASGTVEKSF